MHSWEMFLRCNTLHRRHDVAWSTAKEFRTAQLFVDVWVVLQKAGPTAGEEVETMTFGLLVKGYPVLAQLIRNTVVSPSHW